MRAFWLTGVWTLAIATASSSGCGKTAYLFPAEFVAHATTDPVPLPQPIARQAVLLYQLDDRVEPPPPTLDGLERAVKQTYGNAATTQTIVNNQRSLAGGVAIAAGSAILDGNYKQVVELAARSMRATADDGPDARLYLFLRMRSNHAYKPHVFSCSVDAYLLQTDGTIRHAARAMDEQVYIGGGAPSPPPSGLAQPQGEALHRLLVSNGVDHPYNHLLVLARWAIADLQRSDAPRA
ncbi:MAG TPA: hypothetical protein VG755_24780 [Nannocystaceae bacterium]|nr:hypothetical protein [Nannocystaceae bacterium]